MQKKAGGRQEWRALFGLVDVNPVVRARREGGATVYSRKRGRKIPWANGVVLRHVPVTTRHFSLQRTVVYIYSRGRHAHTQGAPARRGQNEATNQRAQTNTAFAKLLRFGPPEALSK